MPGHTMKKVTPSQLKRALAQRDQAKAKLKEEIKFEKMAVKAFKEQKARANRAEKKVARLEEKMKGMKKKELSIYAKSS